MTDHPFRDELRAVVPTLEPDEAFLAQLGARAAAGAAGAGPVRAAGGWRVALAPVAVAAVLVGIAWLTGLRPADLTDPSPAPAPTDATTQTTSPDAAPPPATSTSRSHPTEAAGAPASTPAAPEHSGAAGTGQGAAGQTGADDEAGPANPGPSQSQGEAHGQGAEHANAHADGHPKRPPKAKHTPGPDEHAGSHPAPQAGQDRHPR